MAELPNRRWPSRLAILATVVTLATWAAAVVAFWLTSSAWLTAAGIGAMLSFILGITVTQFPDRSRWQRLCGRAGLGTGFVGGFTLLALPACASVRDADARQHSLKNLKQLATAMHKYEHANGHLPPASIRDKEGAAMLSWRVVVLPYLDQEDLYRKFNLDEPWDSPHNRSLLPFMPDCYRVAGMTRHDPPQTFFQVLIGKGTAFERDGLRFLDFSDGTQNTFLIVDAHTPVPWTKPEDVTMDDTPLLPKLSYWTHRKMFFFNPTSQDGFIAVMADGSHLVAWPPVAKEEYVRAWATRNGDDKLPNEW